MVTIFVQEAEAGTGDAHAALIGRHCTMFSTVKARPPTLTTTRVTIVAQRKTLCVLERVR
jgi:hypothetical protein